MALDVPSGPREAETPVRFERCEIAQWRGYVTSAFYARRDGDGAAVTPCSPGFRKPEADVDAAREAHRKICDALVGDGWTEIGSAGPWFATRFERPLPAQAEVTLAEESPPLVAVAPRVPEAPPRVPVAPPTTAPPTTAPRPPAKKRPARAVDGGRRWQVAAIAALPAALGLLAWLVAGGG